MRLIDADMTGAVHRLRTIRAAFDVHRAEHVLLEVLEVPGDLKQLFADDVRCVDELISVTKDQSTLVLLDLVSDDRAFWMPEDQARANARIGRVEIELRGESTMIASFRLLVSMQMLLEILLLPARIGVDTLQHLSPLIA